MKHLSNLAQSPLFQSLASAAAGGALIVHGQGVVGVQPVEHAPFKLRLTDSTDTGHWVELTVNEHFRCSPEQPIPALITVHGDDGAEVVVQMDDEAGALDPDLACVYWLSLDGFSCELRYGKGEARKSTTLLTSVMRDTGSYAWFRHLDRFDVTDLQGQPCLAVAMLWRDPVVIEPPLVVVRDDEMTMEMAATASGTVAQSLSEACQRLYATVAGLSFQLDTPDFPYFSEAIEQSIADPNGWCYKTLQAKASEFGKPDIYATYLRITLGQELGNSPGVPFVMEIWPPAHHSPIHNHADAFAVIKVLYGEIHVELFDMLSVHHQTPFGAANFQQGQVTWLAPRVNQTHRLSNPNRVGPTCVTIQCYQYGEDNRAHYEYFDYIDTEGTGIGHFEPNSDMGYMEFKALMKAEWEQRNQKTG